MVKKNDLNSKTFYVNMTTNWRSMSNFIFSIKHILVILFLQNRIQFWKWVFMDVTNQSEKKDLYQHVALDWMVEDMVELVLVTYLNTIWMF